MIFKSLIAGPLQVNCFILACEQTREGIIVDPGENVPDILDLVREDDIQVVEVVATHGHVDHIARAASVIRSSVGPVSVAMPPPYSKIL